jgi:hypothetical protein
VEITEAIIPAPVFMTGSDLARALQDLGAPLSALSLRRDEIFDWQVPDQSLGGASAGRERVLFNIIVHNNIAGQQTEPQQPQVDTQLIALEKLAKADPELRRHRLFWNALSDAKQGRKLARRQRQLLNIAWQRVGPGRKNRRIAPRQTRPTPLKLPFHQTARAATMSRPAYSHWLEREGGSTLGNINLTHVGQRLRRSASAQPQRDDRSLAPKRDDSWLPKLRPTMTDTDSGDD